MPRHRLAPLLAGGFAILLASAGFAAIPAGSANALLDGSDGSFAGSTGAGRASPRESLASPRFAIRFEHGRSGTLEVLTLSPGEILFSPDAKVDPLTGSYGTVDATER